jgi:hypothetical protein
MIRRVIGEARSAGCEWLHADYDEELIPFYAACGFRATAAGVLPL